MDRKLVLVGISIFLGLIAFVFGIVGVSTGYWRTGQDDGHKSLGLWRKCNVTECSDLSVGENSAFYAYETVRGFGVLSVITAFAGVAFGILKIAIKKLNISVSVPTTFFFMSGLFGIICGSVFASLEHATTSDWGYSFALTWVAAPLSIIAGTVSVIPALSK